MKLRRSLALATGALVLAAPALTSCGFDYATDRYYTPANGANDRSGAVDVLSAVVVSTEAGAGTFIATLSNNDQDEPGEFTELLGGEGSGLTVEEFEPIEIGPGDLVNLAAPEEGEPGIPLTGEFAPGGYLLLTLGFANGESVTLNVPVVPNDGYWEGLDGEPLPEEPETETETSH